MANTLLTHDMIAERSLFDLQNQLTMGKHVYRGYNSEFTGDVAGYKKNNTVRIALPNKFRTKNGAAIDKVNVLETNTTVTVDVQEHVAWDYPEADLTFKIADFSRKYTRPTAIALGNIVDLKGCEEYVNIYNEVGTPGTTPSTYKVLTDAALRMDNEAVPRTDRLTVFSPKAHWSMADGELKSVFQAQIVKDLVSKGFVGRFALMDFYMDQNIQTHTVGLWDTGSTGVMNGVTAEGATSLVTDGWAATTAILKQGDIITIAGVYGVNPISGQVWEGNELKQFVVTADTSSVAADATIPISPTIYSSAATEDYLPYQTVGSVPVGGAAITVVGTESTGYPKNLCFHPDCFALTCVPFARPKSANQSVMWSQASDPRMELSITVATGFTLGTYDETTRSDILFGWDTIRPELGCRVTG